VSDADERARFRPKSPRTSPRFSDVATFLRLPRHDDPRDVDVLICGAPFDGGTTFRPGARFGPRAVRNASALTRGFHPAQGVDLFDVLRCADGGDVTCIPMSIERTLENIRARVAEIAAGGALPALVGGDHSITLGALRALAKLHGPLGLVHFDAHCDTYPPAWDIDVHHGTVFRNAAEEGLLRAQDVLQIGIRGPFTSASDLEGSRKLGFRVLMIDEVKRGLAAVEAQLTALGGRGAFYVSFDMDAVDPAYAPGTGTPVPGGLTSYEALALVRALAGIRIVGCDVVEISPDHDMTGNTALLAATVLAELLAVVAQGRAASGS
jgi:agmatinase